MASAQLAAAFRRCREHQRSLWATGGMLSTYPSGRTEHTFASAPYGEHAVSAFASAKRSIFFRKDLARTVAEHSRRSRAAKKAWKARRSAQA